jgi:solute carrier family 27 fatty acid transporter 1/4
MIGNGLRSDIWELFQKRFNIPQIGEFYASTEGNVVLFNTVNERGAIGFVPPLGRWLQPYAVVLPLLTLIHTHSHSLILSFSLPLLNLIAN